MIRLFYAIFNHRTYRINDDNLSDEEVKILMEKANSFVAGTVGNGVTDKTNDVVNMAERVYSCFLRILESVLEDPLDQKILVNSKKSPQALKD